MKTLKVKVRPDSYTWLNACAVEVNQVFNYCNEVSAKAAKPYVGKSKWLSGYDLCTLLAGATKNGLEFLPSASMQQVATEFATRRVQFKKTKLRWRVSKGSKKSLGWIPFKRGQVKCKNGGIVFAGQRFRVFDSYGLDKFDLRGGSFSQDSLGNWYLNIAVNTEQTKTELPTRGIGIDLGLKDVATTSDGQVLPAAKFYRNLEQKIGQAQRRAHKRQAKRLHKKAANCRKDALHKFSTAMVEQYGAIYIGDVSSKKLVKTKMAKAVLDSGWGMLKAMLQYKGNNAGRIVEVVSERYTTQVCSNCGSVSGPKGLKQLVVREWDCPDCGSHHMRDVNAAMNILARGQTGPLAGTTGGASYATH
jgi:putative transposase